MAAASGITPNADTLANVDELRKNNSKYFFLLHLKLKVLLLFLI